MLLWGNVMEDVMEEFKAVVSAPFKKNLSTSLSEKDFEFSLAFDLKWFSPKAASKVKDKALEAGLLLLKNRALVPGFDVGTVRIPQRFRPEEAFLEELESQKISEIPFLKNSQEKATQKPETQKKVVKESKEPATQDISFEQVLEFISADTGVNKQVLVSEINSMQDRLSYLVDIRVVALIIAQRFGCDTTGIFKKVSGAVLGFSDYT
jgi:hypothetical protein